MMSMEKCYSCGAENDSVNKFCNKCGADLKTSSQCPYCKSSVPAGALKCANCGEWVDKRKQIEKDVSRYDSIVAIGWIFALLGGWIGLLIGLYLVTRESQEVRNKGKGILILAIILSVIMGFLMFHISYMNSYRHHYY